MTGPDRNAFAEKARDWWRELRPDPGRGKPGDRATLARLRRCGCVADALFEPAVQALARRCGARHEDDLARVALVAAVLAHVRSDDASQPVARQVGPVDATDAKTALCKPVRFRRVLDADGFDECLRAFRRLVILSGSNVNVSDLARSVLAWPREGMWDHAAAERIRVRWVYEYWNAGEPGNGVTAGESMESEKERQS
ncbi:type I-E CRISPR-associated protein Cse2/CasB [Gluconacetobacter tumulisoli]|uniref:Type I-E CRISPR-associated protein Cse2/CasB n=1 Tax=Gluconacetobacter tumulisoli TaxID=1286189 RepID=A0A7W4K649_9PROT|nr:type I-E CRISPR-associated protein Cse2/CasB [Gluconacetobacter tumulisoli]MBB2201094.1 type I-E CRISPR-associated protein Cse2/CasB [Gluconacetobacter tumulisoli]